MPFDGSLVVWGEVERHFAFKMFMDKGYSICFNDWSLDKSIKSELGLLCIISGLCAEQGYCYASNEYLSNLFDVAPESISRKVNKLIKKGYLYCEYVESKGAIIQRHLRLTKTSIPPKQKRQPTLNKNVNTEKNNTSINNTSNNSQQMNFEDILPIETKKENHTKESLDFPPDENQWREVWNEWNDYRRAQKIKKWARLIDEQRAVNNLINLSNGNIEIAKKVILQSIENGYTGLFELKKRKNESNRDVLKKMAGL